MSARTNESHRQDIIFLTQTERWLFQSFASKAFSLQLLQNFSVNLAEIQNLGLDQNPGNVEKQTAIFLSGNVVFYWVLNASFVGLLCENTFLQIYVYACTG